jgi:uncharacterized protein YacL
VSSVLARTLGERNGDFGRSPIIWASWKGEPEVSVDFVFRLLGMITLAIGGGYLGIYMRAHLGGAAETTSPELWAIVCGLVGALIGLIATPFFTIRPARTLRNIILQIPASTLLASMIGLIVGLTAATLLSFPLGMLPKPFSQIMPILSAGLFCWVSISIFVMRQRDIFSLFRGRIPTRLAAEGSGTANDGRIADIARTGFISGTILVPRFVLHELQHIADSAEPLRRNRGRRGLEVLNELQKDAPTLVRFTDMDAAGVREVDDKLVVLAKQLNCAIITNDYNLNHVAQLQGVSVLNINELANALKAVLLPGERLEVKIIQAGKEAGQGVGYLDDGTMIVVDDGYRHVSEKVNAVVTKIFQTTAGRMIFAKLDNNK